MADEDEKGSRDLVMTDTGGDTPRTFNQDRLITIFSTVNEADSPLLAPLPSDAIHPSLA